jgi:hypothetical protein
MPEQLKKFHILFKDRETDMISRGQNFAAATPLEALIKFQETYPFSHFLCLYDLNEFSSFLYR